MTRIFRVDSEYYSGYHISNLNKPIVI